MSKRTYLLNLSLTDDSAVPEVFDAYVLMSALNYRGPNRVTKSRMFEKMLQTILHLYPDGLPAEIIDSEDVFKTGYDKKLTAKFRGKINELLTPLIKE